MKTGQLRAWLWKGLCLPGRSGEPSFPANPRTSLGGDGAATVSLGRPVFDKLKMVQRRKTKSWQAITNKEVQKGFSERITSHHEKSELPSCQMANTYVFKLEFLDITDYNPTAYLGTVLPT